MERLSVRRTARSLARFRGVPGVERKTSLWGTGAGKSLRSATAAGAGAEESVSTDQQIGESAMTEYQRIVHEIRAVCAAEQDPNAERLARLARQYAAAVEAVNVRLAECEELLARGLRTEALQAAEVPPNLLEAVALLDFAERDQWADYVVQFGLPPPPELLLEIAADVNEAYSVEAPLVQLMRRHRLHALARSPLRRRIAVMRQIARLDRQNPIWESDLRTFEKARLGELPAEVAAAVKRGDLNALSRLEQEVKSPQWCEPPSPALIQHITETHTRLRARQARAQLVELEKQLTQAYSSLDVEAARRLREQWNARAALAGMAPDDPLVELVTPALEWLAEQDRAAQQEADFAAAIAALERALDHELPRSELERRYHAAFRFDREVPPLLCRRVTDRLDDLDRQEARKNRLVLTVIAVSVLAVGALTGWGIQRHLEVRELQAHLAGARLLLEEGKLAEADAYLADLKRQAPEMFDTPELRRLRGDLDAALAQEHGRRSRREQALLAARTAGIEQPTWDSLPAAFEQLAQAAKLSATDIERAEVQALERQVRSVQADLQRTVDEQFDAALTDLRKRLEALAVNDLEGIQQLLAEAAALRSRPRVTAELTVQLDPLIARLQGMRQTEVERRASDQALEQITAAVGNRAQFLARLQDYAARYSTSTRAADFQRCLQWEAAWWQKLETWQEVVTRVSRRNLAALSPAEARTLAGDLAAVLRQSPAFFRADQLQMLQEYAASVARRTDESGRKLHLSLVETLNNPTVAQLYMVLSRDGRRHYCREQPVFTSGAVSVRYFTGFDLSKTSLRRFPEAEVANPRSEGRIVWTAPQSAFSRDAQDQLAALTDGNWEAAFAAMVTRLQTDPHLDPLLKLQLLQRVLEIGGEGSTAFRHAFARHQEILEASPVDPTVNWIDPDDADGQTARALAERIVRRLPDPQAAAAALQDRLAELKQPDLGGTFRWIGWLRRDRNGNWMGAAPVRPVESLSAELFVLSVPAADAPGQLVPIGRLAGGAFQLAAGDAALLVEGRPVYAAIVPQATTPPPSKPPPSSP